MIWQILSIIIPIALIWGVFAFAMRRMGGSGGIMGVGKSTAKMYVEKSTGVTFRDVAGQDEAKETLQEMVDFLNNPNKYTAIGAKLPKGALLVGPPVPVRPCWPRLWQERRESRFSPGRF